MANAIRAQGIEVVTYKQQAPELPDSVFPNNWFSTHRTADIPGKQVVIQASLDGLFVLYPMKAASREKEKNPELVAAQSTAYGHLIDLQRQTPEQALEGTGSLLFDVENRKVYCSLSERADETLLESFMKDYNRVAKRPYRAVTWHSCDPKGSPIYHTNVLMAILRDHVVVCTESVRDPEERSRLVTEITSPELNAKPKEIIDISYDEMLDMAGNMIMVQGKDRHCVIMSERARRGLRPANRDVLEKHYTVISADINMIETIGGGSARCMVAELF